VNDPLVPNRGNGAVYVYQKSEDGNTQTIVGQTALKDKKVQSFAVSHVIHAPADKVWAIVGEDYGAIAKSHPEIIKSEYLNGSLKGGEGAERICYFNDKGSKFVKEKQINFDPENYTFKNTIYQTGKFPLDPAYRFALYTVEVIDAETSRFTFKMQYCTKPSMMGSMAKGKFQKLISNYAIAIEHHVVTGEDVNKENFKAIKKEHSKDDALASK
ncbi:MAG: hypothetical protein ACI959_000844, partial [Limisphaerales bacterium]